VDAENDLTVLALHLVAHLGALDVGDARVGVGRGRSGKSVCSIPIVDNYQTTQLSKPRDEI
jgi:hypothetical protein